MRKRLKELFKRERLRLLSGHYLWAGERLASSGLAVYALDLRGRGRSEGDRYHVYRIEGYLDDVDGLVERGHAARR